MIVIENHELVFIALVACFQQDGRYSRRPDPYDQEYDRRRVRFSNDGPSPRKEYYDR